MRVTVKLKLGLAFAAIIVLTIITAWVGLSNLSALNARLNTVLQGPAQRLAIVLELSETLLATVRSEKNIIPSEGKEEADGFEAELVRLRQDLTTRLENAENSSTSTGKPLYAAARMSWQRYLAVQDKIIEAARRGDKAGARLLSVGQGRQAVAETRANLGKLVDLNRQRFREAETDAQSAYENAWLTLVGVVAASILIALSTGAWIALGISRGLARATVLANAVAAGDLDHQATVKTNDEIKDVVDALNRMTLNLRGSAAVADTIAGGDLTIESKRLSDKDTLGIALERMLGKLRTVVAEASGAADNVSSGSQELSSSSEQLSQGATEQASAAEEASA